MTRKWLVQATGNATLQSLTHEIEENRITVDRHYVFIMIGHNQLQLTEKSKVIQLFTALIQAIRARNNWGKIFVVALLPRPVDNDTAKPLIVKFNRAMAQAIGRIRKRDQRVLLLPAQHKFILDASPIIQYYHENKYCLSQLGGQVLKDALFQLAGFVKNV